MDVIECVCLCGVVGVVGVPGIRTTVLKNTYPVPINFDFFYHFSICLSVSLCLSVCLSLVLALSWHGMVEDLSKFPKKANSFVIFEIQIKFARRPLNRLR